MANEETRLFLTATPWRIQDVKNLDLLWRERSENRFGFTQQCNLWHQVGGSNGLVEGELWRSFERLGDRIGWRSGGHWACWTDVPCPPITPTIPVEIDLDDCPFGLLPLHDVVASGDWKHEFSPRDCWGEAVWSRWAELFRLLTS